MRAPAAPDTMNQNEWTEGLPSPLCCLRPSATTVGPVAKETEPEDTGSSSWGSEYREIQPANSDRILQLRVPWVLLCVSTAKKKKKALLIPPQLIPTVSQYPSLNFSSNLQFSGRNI